MLLPLPVRQRGTCSAVNLDLEAANVVAAVDVLKALADPARLQMVAALRDAREPVCICDFTEALSLSQPTISHHMGKLRRAGIVDVTREGIWSFYQLAPGLPPRVRRLIDGAVAMGMSSTGSL